jgi:hypothetical protein
VEKQNRDRILALADWAIQQLGFKDWNEGLRFASGFLEALAQKVRLIDTREKLDALLSEMPDQSPKALNDEIETAKTLLYQFRGRIVRFAKDELPHSPGGHPRLIPANKHDENHASSRPIGRPMRVSLGSLPLSTPPTQIATDATYINPKRMKMRRRCRESLSARSADFHPRHIIHPRIAVATDTPIMTVASIAAGLSALTCAAIVIHFLQVRNVLWDSTAPTVETSPYHSKPLNELYKKGCQEKSSASTGGRDSFSRSSPLRFTSVEKFGLVFPFS